MFLKYEIQSVLWFLMTAYSRGKLFEFQRKTEKLLQVICFKDSIYSYVFNFYLHDSLVANEKSCIINLARTVSFTIVIVKQHQSKMMQSIK